MVDREDKGYRRISAEELQQRRRGETAPPTRSQNEESTQPIDLWEAGQRSAGGADQRGALSRGVGGGLLSLRASGAGIAALAGDRIGSDRLRDWGFERYQELQERVSETMQPEQEVENVESLGDAWQFAQYWVGYGLSQLGPTAGAGAIGSAVGRRLVRQGVDRYLQTQAARNRVSAMTAQGVPQEAAENSVREVASRAMQTAANRAARRGALAGSGVPSAVQQIGATYGQAGEQAIAEGGTLDDVDVGRAVAAGTAGAGLQYIGQLTQLGALGVGPGRELLSRPFNAMAGATGGSVRRGLTRGTTAATVEGTAEVGQEFTQAFGAGREAPEPKDLMTPFAAGAVGGAAVGTAGGFFGRRAPTLEEQREVRRQEQTTFEERVETETPVTSADVVVDPQIDAVPTPSTLDSEGAKLAKARLTPGMSRSEIETEFLQVPTMRKRDGTLRKDASRLADDILVSSNDPDPAVAATDKPGGVGRSAWDKATRDPAVKAASTPQAVQEALKNPELGLIKKSTEGTENVQLNANGRRVAEAIAKAKDNRGAQPSRPVDTQEQGVLDTVNETSRMSDEELNSVVREQTETPAQQETSAQQETPAASTPSGQARAEAASRIRPVFTTPPPVVTAPEVELAPFGDDGVRLAQERALFLATQGYTPNAVAQRHESVRNLSDDVRAEDNLAKVEVAGDESTGPVLPEAENRNIIDLFDDIHRTTRIRDTAASRIAGSGTRAVTDESVLAAASDFPPNDRTAQNIDQYRQSSRDLEGFFQQLENKIGTKTINQALANAKRLSAAKNENVPSRMQGTETSDGVRFSQAWNQYRDGRLGSPFISPRVFRHANEVETTDPGPSPKVRDILNGKYRVLGRIKAKSQADAVLLHVRHTSESPVARRLAGMLRSVLDENGLLEKGKVRFKIMSKKQHSASTGGRPSKAALTSFPAKSENVPHYAHVTLYKGGQNTATMLHELVHVASQATLEQAAQRKGTKAAQQAYAELTKISRQLSGLDEAQVRNQYGERTAEILKIVRAPKKSTPQRELLNNVSELLAYGFTDEGFQRLMLDQDTPTSGRDVQASQSFLGQREKLGALWNRFVGVVKRLVGAGRIANTEFERFVFASSSLLQEAATARNQLQNETRRRELSSIGHIPPRDDDSFNPSAAMEDADTAQAAQTAWRIDTAHLDGAQRVKEKERLAAQAKRDEESAQAREARVEEQRRERGDDRSAVPTDQAIDSARRDATIFDRIGRNVMDSIGGFIAGVDNFDYQSWAEGRLQRGSERINDFVAGGTDNDPAAVSALRKAVGYSLGQTVDKYGVPSGLKGLLYRLQATVWTNDTRLRELGQQLHNLTENQQFAILEALDNGNDTRIEATITDANELRLAKELASEVRALFKKGQELGLLSDVDQHSTLLDYIRVGSRKELGLKDSAQLRKSAAATVGKLSGGSRALAEQTAVTNLHVIGSNGHVIPVQNIQPGMKFLRARKMDGETYYISPELTHGQVKKEGLVPDYEHPTTLFTVRKTNKTTGDVTFTRPRTPDELASSDERADLMASVLLSTQALSHRVATLEFQDSMLVVNKGMAKDDRWITEALPDDVPESRLIDLKSPGALSKARMPGRWVKVPDEPNVWGDLSGMYMSGPTYAAMKDMQNTDPMLLNKSPMFSLMNRVWKKNMTTWSPVTHMNNIGGNFTLQYFHDIPSSNMKTAFEVVLHKLYPQVHRRVYKRDLPENLRKLNEEVENMGIQLVAHKYNELDPESANELALAITQWRRDGNDDASSTSATATATALEAISGTVAKFDRTLSELYSNQDNVFRIAAYMTYVQNEQAKGRAPDRTVMEEAGAYARDSFVNYRIDAPLINALRTGAFGYQMPFLAWTYRAVPLVAKTALTKPWKMAVVTGALRTINAMAYTLLGADEEEERELLPDFMSRNIWGVGAPMSIRMPLGDDENPVFFHTGNMIPAADLFTMDRSANVPTAAVPGGPMMVMLQAALNYDTFRDDDIVYDTSQTPVQDFAAFVARNGGPRLLVSAFDTGHDLVVDPSGPLGHKPNKVLNLARFMGLNMREVNLPEQQLYQSMNVQRIRREYSAAINRLNREYHRQGRFQSYEKLLRDTQRLVEAMEDDIAEELGLD